MLVRIRTSVKEFSVKGIDITNPPLGPYPIIFELKTESWKKPQLTIYYLVLYLGTGLQEVHVHDDTRKTKTLALSYYTYTKHYSNFRAFYPRRTLELSSTRHIPLQ